MAGSIPIGSLFPGRRKGGDLGRTVGIAPPLLPGAGLPAARAAGVGGQSSEAGRAGEVASAEIFVSSKVRKRGVCERSAGSTHPANVQKQYSLLGSGSGI